MKLDPYPSAGQKKKSRPPLISFAELASEFGVSELKLAGLMRSSSVPLPGFSRRTGSRSGWQVTYYEAKPMRDWWKAYNAAKDTK